MKRRYAIIHVLPIMALHSVSQLAFECKSLANDDVYACTSNVSGITVAAMTPHDWVVRSNAVLLAIVSNQLGSTILHGDNFMTDGGIRIRVEDMNSQAMQYTEEGGFSFGWTWTNGESGFRGRRDLKAEEWHVMAIHLPSIVEITNDGTYNVFVTWDSMLAGGVNTAIHPVVLVTNIHVELPPLPIHLNSFATSSLPSIFTNELGSRIEELPQRGSVDRWMWPGRQ